MNGSNGTSATEQLYARLAPIYDFIYGATLQPGRARAMARLAAQAGERILEIGVGTGVALRGYPAGTRVAAVDLSAPMLHRAQARLRRHRIRHVALCRMDATHLAFADGSFDAVYAPYVVNVVADPVRVAHEMMRVCRPGGRLVLVNHFARADNAGNFVSEAIGELASKISGVDWGLDLDWFLRESGLQPYSVESVNMLKSAIVLCRKPVRM